MTADTNNSNKKYNENPRPAPGISGDSAQIPRGFAGDSAGISAPNSLIPKTHAKGNTAMPDLPGPIPETDQPSDSSARYRADMAKLARAGLAPRCSHVKLNGLRCGSPAMRHTPYCYFHDRWLNRPSDDSFPPFEDGNSVQFALMEIVERLRREAFRGGAVDPRFIKPLIFAVKTAVLNLRNTSFDPAQEQSLTLDPIDDPDAPPELVPLAPRKPASRAPGNGRPVSGHGVSGHGFSRAVQSAPND